MASVPQLSSDKSPGGRHRWGHLVLQLLFMQNFRLLLDPRDVLMAWPGKTCLGAWHAHTQFSLNDPVVQPKD